VVQEVSIARSSSGIKRVLSPESAEEPHNSTDSATRILQFTGVAILTCGRRTEKIRAFELGPEAAAPIFRDGPLGIRAVFVRLYICFTLSRYLGVSVKASLEEFEGKVLTHPVFLVQSMNSF
jgi:hypothetical protein